MGPRREDTQQEECGQTRKGKRHSMARKPPSLHTHTHTHTHTHAHTLAHARTRTHLHTHTLTTDTQRRCNPTTGQPNSFAGVPPNRGRPPWVQNEWLKNNADQSLLRGGLRSTYWLQTFLHRPLYIIRLSQQCTPLKPPPFLCTHTQKNVTRARSSCAEHCQLCSTWHIRWLCAGRRTMPAAAAHTPSMSVHTAAAGAGAQAPVQRKASCTRAHTHGSTATQVPR